LIDSFFHLIDSFVDSFSLCLPLSPFLSYVAEYLIKIVEKDGVTPKTSHTTLKSKVAHLKSLYCYIAGVCGTAFEKELGREPDHDQSLSGLVKTHRKVMGTGRQLDLKQQGRCAKEASSRSFTKEQMDNALSFGFFNEEIIQPILDANTGFVSVNKRKAKSTGGQRNKAMRDLDTHLCLCMQKGTGMRWDSLQDVTLGQIDIMKLDVKESIQVLR
jgi:hypothetical protein